MSRTQGEETKVKDPLMKYTTKPIEERRSELMLRERELMQGDLMRDKI